MKELKFKYWKDENFWIGYLELYPDYWTQGETEDELQENLREIFEVRLELLNKKKNN